MINAVEKNTLEVLPAYQAAVERLYTEGSDPDDVYREANREVFGAEYAFRVYNKEAYAKAQEVVTQGVSWDDYYDYYFSVKGRDAGREEEKKSILDSMDLSDQERLSLYEEAVASDTKKDLIESLRSEGVSEGDIYAYIDYYGQSSFQEMLRYGIEQNQAGLVYDTVKGLTPEAGGKSVTAQQKYTAIAEMDLSEAEKLAAILAYDPTEDASAYSKYAAAYDAGISVEEFDAYRVETSGIEPDRDGNGNAISGSKKEKVLAVIDAMPITLDQKDFLYRLEGYAESTLFDAPWYKYAGQLPAASNGFRGLYTGSSGLRSGTLRGQNRLRGQTGLRSGTLR